MTNIWISGCWWFFLMIILYTQFLTADFIIFCCFVNQCWPQLMTLHLWSQKLQSIGWRTDIFLCFWKSLIDTRVAEILMLIIFHWTRLLYSLLYCTVILYVPFLSLYLCCIWALALSLHNLLSNRVDSKQDNSSLIPHLGQMVLSEFQGHFTSIPSLYDWTLHSLSFIRDSLLGT